MKAQIRLTGELLCRRSYGSILRDLPVAPKKFASVSPIVGINAASLFNPGAAPVIPCHLLPCWPVLPPLYMQCHNTSLGCDLALAVTLPCASRASMLSLRVLVQDCCLG